MRTLYLVLMMSVFLTGFTACEPRPVIVTELPADHLLKDCPIFTPPSRAQFVKLTEEEREALLVEMNYENITNLQVCNTNKLALRKWKTDMKELMKKYE